MNTLLIRDKMALRKFKVTAHCCLKNVLVHLEISRSPNADDEGARTCQKNFGLTMGLEVACNTIRSLWIVTKQRGMVQEDIGDFMLCGSLTNEKFGRKSVV